MRRIIDLTVKYHLRNKNIDCLFVFLSDNPCKTNGSTNVPFDRFSVIPVHAQPDIGFDGLLDFDNLEDLDESHAKPDCDCFVASHGTRQRIVAFQLGRDQPVLGWAGVGRASQKDEEDREEEEEEEQRLAANGAAAAAAAAMRQF